jgi:AraC-like DNA-binding protein
MKLSAMNPFLRYASSFRFTRNHDFVGVLDCRLFYVENGHGTLETEDVTYELNPGNLLYCPSGSIYKLCADPSMKLHVLNFDLSYEARRRVDSIAPVPLDSFRKEDIPAPFHITNAEMLNEMFLIKEGASFYSDLQQIIKEFSQHRIYYREKCSALLKNMLVDMCREHQNGSDHSVHSMEQILKYIELHFNEEISNQKLAEMVGYHEYHLNRIFLKHTGLTLHKYLIKYRLNEAKRLLISTELPVYQIGEWVGFKTTPYFSDCFTKEYGMSPSKYRKTFRNMI